MRSVLLLSVLAAMAVAAPRPTPQELEIDAVEALPDPTVTGPDPTATAEFVTYSSKALASSVKIAVATDPVTLESTADALVRRDPGDCAIQPDGNGPKTSPDTASDFLANPVYAAAASSAASAPPAGYTTVFTNLQGSIGQGGYAGFKQDLKTYDLAYCSSECNRDPFCLAFNIFYERDPSVDPGDACPNPPSIVNIKCTFWRYPIAAASATNTGQPRGPIDPATNSPFIVAVAGSNGYVKKIPAQTLTNFTAATDFNNAAINAPSSSNSYIGVKVFDTGSYDPSLCAAACQANTDYNKRSAIRTKASTYRACNFFNSYILLKNGVGSGTTCSLYTQTWDASYATNKGQTRGTDKYTTAESFGYSLSPQDSGVIATSG